MLVMGVVRIIFQLYIIKEIVTENITRNQNGITKRLPSIANLCPYNQFCTSSPLKAIPSQDTDSCCEKCSCTSDCHETGSCCYDAPSAGSTKPKYPCKYITQLTKQVPGLTIRHMEVLRFNVITNCSNSALEQKYPKCNKPTDIEDFVIVSDPQTEMVYRNKHCAECNNVHKYESWLVNIVCLGRTVNFHKETFEEIEQNWQDNCSLVSYPPNGKAGLMSHCNPYIVSECNVTGRWDTYDEELFEACNENRDNQNAVFRRPTDNFAFRDSFDYYSSVYCYLCNEPKAKVKKDECKVIDPYLSGKTGGFIRIFGHIENIDHEKDLNGQGLPCKSFDIWDPFKKICRQLMCPSSQKPLNGRCVGLLSNMVGLAYVLNFEITFVDGPKPEINRNLLSKLEIVVFSKLGKEFKCGKCITRLLSHPRFADSVFLQFEIFTTESCSDEALLRRMREIAGAEKLNARLKENQNIVKIELKLRFQKFYGNESFEALLNMKYSICLNPQVIDSTIFKQCWHILISNEEAEELGYNITNAPVNETDNDSLPICLDTYFSKRNSTSGAHSIFVNVLDGWTLCLQARIQMCAVLWIFVKSITVS